MLLFAGLFNVAELPFVRDDLDGGRRRLRRALDGRSTALGFVAGSLSGSKRRSARGPQAQCLLAASRSWASGSCAAALAPSLLIAALAFALAGVGNGLILVYERLLIQVTVPRPR